jgi:hypothetical protein
MYLVVVDYYSRFIEIAKLSSTTSPSIVTHMKSMFSRHGIPETVVSDNGPQYSSTEFSQFATNWGFQHVTSSPLYPQSNGLAERAVKTVKHLLDTEDPYIALLAYRSTPLEVGLSPAELLMSRKIRSTIPIIQAQLHPCVQDGDLIRDRDVKLKERQKSNYDDRHGVRPLPALETGDKVYVRDKHTSAHVIEPAMTPRSSWIRTEEGSVMRRNRSALRPLPDLTQPSVETPDVSSPNHTQQPPMEVHRYPTRDNIQRPKHLTDYI